MRSLVLIAAFFAAATALAAVAPAGMDTGGTPSTMAPATQQLAAAAPPRTAAAIPNLSLLDAILAAPATQARVVGYVVARYTCPACGAGVPCPPCPRPTQVTLKEIIKEAPVPLSLPPTPTLVVEVPDANVFAAGKAYRFEVVTTNSAGINARLLRFQPADEAPWPDAAPR